LLEPQALDRGIAFKVARVVALQVAIDPATAGITCCITGPEIIRTLVISPDRQIRESSRSDSARLLPAGDNQISGNEVGWQLEGIRDGTIPCNGYNDIAAPGLTNIIIHDDPYLSVALPVRACEIDGCSGGIISKVAGHCGCGILKHRGCGGVQQ